MFSMPSIFGAILIVAIKFVGYRYAGVWLNLSFAGLTRTNRNIFGVIRTILGLVAGPPSATSWARLISTVG